MTTKTITHRIATLFLSVGAFITFAGAVTAAPVNKDKKGVALDGYDTVAFHTQSAAVKGKKAITATHEGAIYRFASEENKKSFTENPEKYLPQFGGYCAWGISEKKELFPIDVKTWKVVDGKLYLNYNKSIKKKFEKDLATHIKQAHANWPALAAETK